MRELLENEIQAKFTAIRGGKSDVVLFENEYGQNTRQRNEAKVVPICLIRFSQTNICKTHGSEMGP